MWQGACLLACNVVQAPCEVAGCLSHRIIGKLSDQNPTLTLDPPYFTPYKYGTVVVLVCHILHGWKRTSSSVGVPLSMSTSSSWCCTVCPGMVEWLVKVCWVCKAKRTVEMRNAM